MNSKRLTMHTPDGACLILKADNEQDAQQELMEKFKEACLDSAEVLVNGIRNVPELRSGCHVDINGNNEKVYSVNESVKGVE